MVRQITPRENELLNQFRKYDLTSQWAEFDTTRDDLQWAELEDIEKRANLLILCAYRLSTIEKEYEALTREHLPKDCSDILERFYTSCQTLISELTEDNN